MIFSFQLCQGENGEDAKSWPLPKRRVLKLGSGCCTCNSLTFLCRRVLRAFAMVLLVVDVVCGG